MHMHIHAEAVCPSVCLCEDVPVCEMCDMLRKLRPKICLLGRESERVGEKESDSKGFRLNLYDVRNALKII